MVVFPIELAAAGERVSFFSFFVFLMLPRQHGEGGGGNGDAQTGLGEVHGLVVFAVGQLEQLVGGEGRGCDADDKVNVLAEVDVLGDVLEAGVGTRSVVVVVSGVGIVGGDAVSAVHGGWFRCRSV